MSIEKLFSDTVDVIRMAGNLVVAVSWIVGTGWTYLSGSASYTGVSGSGSLSQALTLKAGTKYRLEMNVTVDGGTPTLAVTVGGTTFDSATTDGSYASEGRATDTTGLFLTGDGIGGNDITIDSIELLELDSMRNIVRSESVQYADVKCRIDEKTGKELVDGQYTEISTSKVFTTQRGITHDDKLRVKTVGNEAVTPYDLEVDRAPEFKKKTRFHHVEIQCLKVTN